jgi:MFS family permease
MGACTASCLVGTLVGGYLADTYSRKAVVLWSMVASALAYSLVPFTAEPRSICTLIVLALGIMAVSKPAYNALVADFTGSVERKAAFSLLYLGVNVGFAVGPVAGSLRYDHYERALPSDRGRLNVLLELGYEVGFGLGPVVAGAIILRHGVGAVWPWAAGVGVAATAVMASTLWGPLGASVPSSTVFDELPAE